jgi:hypothetical protein
MDFEYDVDPDLFDDQGDNSDDEDYIQGGALPPGLDADDDFADGEPDAEANREHAELQMAGDFK